MTHVGEITAGYVITAATLIGYAAWVLVRSRSLAREVDALADPEERPQQ